MISSRPVPRALSAQQRFFRAGETLSVDARLTMLRKLRLAVHAREADILAALKADLGKSAAEGYMSEIGMLYAEIRHMLKHLTRYAKPKAVRPSVGQLPGRGEIRPVPKGNVLIIAPWNYPFALALLPAVDAIAAGNTVIIKPSELAPATSRVLSDLVQELLPEEWIALMPGDAETSKALLDQPFHHIFYTGGGRVGRIVMRRAARQLIPVTLELGGKSPCLVTPDANLPLAARHIVFGKFLNCGQTCVAPDYVYVHESVKDELIAEMETALHRFYGASPMDSPHYGKIINRAHFDRLLGLLEGERPILGGHARPASLQIAPTIVETEPTSLLMDEEIFGPILPILTYTKLNDAVAAIRKRETPLAFYLFTQNKALQERLMAEIPFGGGCVNDTVIHLASSRMGFGGLGESGLGAYHGKAGFDEFSHQKSILYQSSRVDMPLRYPPYGRLSEAFLRLVLR